MPDFTRPTRVLEVCNRDTGEIVTTYKTWREAVEHVERFPSDDRITTVHLYTCNKCGTALADGFAAREHTRNGCAA